jgi:hypothetical protein
MTSRRALRLAALVIVLAPVAAAVVLLFGGTAYPTCLGGLNPGCWPRALVGPFIRTVEGVYLSLAICGVAWLAANAVILVHLVRVDRRRLARLLVAVALFAAATAAIGFLDGLQQRLRAAAEGAVGWGLGGLAIAWVIGLTWVGLRSRRLTEAPLSGDRQPAVD